MVEQEDQVQLSERRLRVRISPMSKERRPTQLEPMAAHPGFRATHEQFDWLREASAAHGFVNLSEWLRHLAIASGEAKLGTPYPRRKQLPPAGKSRRSS